MSPQPQHWRRQAWPDRIEPPRTQLVEFARRQPGCREAAGPPYGAGSLCAAIIWAEIAVPSTGSCRRAMPGWMHAALLRWQALAGTLVPTGLTRTALGSVRKRPNAPSSRWSASCCAAAVTACVSSATPLRRCQRPDRGGRDVSALRHLVAGLLRRPTSALADGVVALVPLSRRAHLRRRPRLGRSSRPKSCGYARPTRGGAPTQSTLSPHVPEHRSGPAISTIHRVLQRNR
jgi:hypothetical protein